MSGPSAAIIGAGAAGIAPGAKLVRAGFDDLVIYEQSDGIGGTWWDNTYPGCEVDIHSHFYSYSFVDWDWSRTHAAQPEIQAYLQHTAETFGLLPKIRLRSRVESAAWSDETSRWTVTLADGTTRDFDVVVSCLGFLNNPRYPEWPGLESFSGAVFHTSRWDHDLDLTGRRVAFVGTGSTAAQAVPAIAPQVEQLYLFQREPGWVLPKADRDYTDAERGRFRRSRVARRIERFRRYRAAGRLVAGVWREDTKLNAELRAIAETYIAEAVPDPVLRAAVTPDYPFGCKRTVQASGFYPALARDNVELVPHAVESAGPRGLVAANGEKYEVDTVILGTGFQADRYLATVTVTGRRGMDLQAFWDDEPKAFAGAAVPNFPNLFIVYGPNTNGGGSAIFQIEQGVDLVVRMVRRLARGSGPLEVSREAYELYNLWLDRFSAKRLTVQRHCHNYYYSATGRNVTQWPGSHLQFRLVTWLLPKIGIRAAHPEESG
ncbi:NAD(P)/FAD-dependent oxidoreductase [Pseudonocardia ailaonensis]|uniref:NAD(P)/FAD-dependent oxidoreductase n=1 Tax=Pseudonocardia ailaonensis TaxID=367279 RepID=A0ABN2N311_9PSEU